MTGIINGSGSITAAIGQLAIPVLYDMGNEEGVGYRYVWYFLIVCTVIGTSLMGGKISKELASIDSTPMGAAGEGRGYQAVGQSDPKV